MAKTRRQSEAMRAILKKNKVCELCGGDREVQAHHIIPICVGGPDIESNIVAVCRKCHAVLTPHGLLSSMGIERVRQDNPINALLIRIYERLNEICEQGERIDVALCLDIMDEEFANFTDRWKCTFRMSQAARYKASRSREVKA